MNIERMLKVADAIENGFMYEGHRIGFDMDWFDRRDGGRDGRSRVGEPIPKCGTACCIGGHACLMFGERGAGIDDVEAQALLGLTDHQAERLFFNDEDYISHIGDWEEKEITRAEGAAAIRKMVAEEGSAEVLGEPALAELCK